MHMAMTGRDRGIFLVVSMGRWDLFMVRCWSCGDRFGRYRTIHQARAQRRTCVECDRLFQQGQSVSPRGSSLPPWSARAAS